MTIDRVESFVLVAPMSRGRGPSIANYKTRESILLKITDSSGAVGWGETYAAAGLPAVLRELGEMLVGRDPLRARNARRMNGSGRPTGHTDLARTNDRRRLTTSGGMCRCAD